MVKAIKNLLLIAALVFTGTSCGEDNGGGGDGGGDTGEVGKLETNQWILDEMNDWYLWPESVSGKSANATSEFDAFFISLLSSNDGYDYYNSQGSINHQYFSYITRKEKTRADAEDAILQFGFDFTIERIVHDRGTGNLTDDDLWVVFRVSHVLPGSPADNAGLKRGNVITQIDGKRITLTNYTALYPAILSAKYSEAAPKTTQLTWYSSVNAGRWFTLYYENGTSFPKQGSVLGGLTEKIISPVTMRENPVHKSTVVTSGRGRTVGYLCYNSFDYGNRQTHDWDDKLKEAFREFKAEGVNELVVDLRFNGGGAVSTCQLLASMITTESNVNTSFQRMYYNTTITKRYYSNRGYADVPFLSTSQMKGDYYGNGVDGVRLGLSRVYVLVSGQSASASEALIFGLRGAQNPAEVFIIGERTVGKTVGMTLSDKTLGDYDYEMWPVSFVMANSQGVKADVSPYLGGYRGGYIPDMSVVEFDYPDWKELGSPDEALFAMALYHMDNGAFPASRAATAALDTRATGISLPDQEIDFRPTLRKGGMRDHGPRPIEGN